MPLNGHIDSGAWSVEAVTSPAPQGGFCCEVRVMHGSQSQPFSMVWIDLKVRHAFEM